MPDPDKKVLAKLLAHSQNIILASKKIAEKQAALLREIEAILAQIKSEKK